jgi:hypothetical protein
MRRAGEKADSTFLHLFAANNTVNARPPPSRIPAAAAGFSLAR